MHCVHVLLWERELNIRIILRTNEKKITIPNMYTNRNRKPVCFGSKWFGTDYGMFKAQRHTHNAMCFNFFFHSFTYENSYTVACSFVGPYLLFFLNESPNEINAIYEWKRTTCVWKNATQCRKWTELKTLDWLRIIINRVDGYENAFWNGSQFL